MKESTIIKQERRRQFRKAEVAMAIRSSGGLMKNVAKALECSIGTVRDYLDKNQDLQELMAHEMNSALDVAKDTIMQAIKDGDVGAAKWYLEYVQKSGWKPDSQKVIVSFVDDIPKSEG